MPTDHLAGPMAILITNAASPAGIGLARHLAGAGHHLGLGDRDPASLDGLAAAIRAGGGRALCRPLDAADSGDMLAFADWSFTQFGNIDTLINHPASGTDDWDGLIDTSFRATLNGLAALAPRMQAQGVGRIVNLAPAIAGPYPYPLAALHALTHAALRRVVRDSGGDAGTIEILSLDAAAGAEPVALACGSPHLSSRST